MFCANCQRDVSFCTCPDIAERMGQLARHTGIHIANQRITSHGPVDRPVFPTEIQPCYDPEREVRGMTRVVTRSGSVYRFRSEDGKTYIEKYDPDESSQIGAERMDGQVVLFSEYPIEVGYPLALRLENGVHLNSTPITKVELELK